MFVSILCSGRAHRGLDGDRKGEGERRRSRWPVASAKDGVRRTFLSSREEWRPFFLRPPGEKSSPHAVASKAIEPKAAFA
jgi:hypothetical protein